MNRRITYSSRQDEMILDSARFTAIRLYGYRQTTDKRSKYIIEGVAFRLAEKLAGPKGRVVRRIHTKIDPTRGEYMELKVEHRRTDFGDVLWVNCAESTAPREKRRAPIMKALPSQK